MNALLGFVLALVSPFALAAGMISMESLIDTVIYLLIIGFIFGILIFLVNRAPIIPAEWKVFIVYFIYFVGALVLINLLLGLTGHPIVVIGR